MFLIICCSGCLAFQLPPLSWAWVTDSRHTPPLSFLSLHLFLCGCLGGDSTVQRGFRGTSIGNWILCLQDPGSFHGSLQHETGKPEKGLRTSQNPEAGASPEEELPEAGTAVSPHRSRRGSRFSCFLLNSLARFFWLHLLPPSVTLWLLWNHRNQMWCLLWQGCRPQTNSQCDRGHMKQIEHNSLVSAIARPCALATRRRWAGTILVPHHESPVG